MAHNQLGRATTTYREVSQRLKTKGQVALNSGEAAEAAAKVFNYKRREFRLKNGARSSANMSLEQIRNCLDILADADMRLKSTALDERRILEELMLRLMLIS